MKSDRENEEEEEEAIQILKSETETALVLEFFNSLKSRLVHDQWTLTRSSSIDAYLYQDLAEIYTGIAIQILKGKIGTALVLEFFNSLKSRLVHDQ